MTDLPFVSPAAATAAQPCANAASRTASSRDGAPLQSASPFQDALALELGFALDNPLLTDLGVPAGTAKAGNSLKPGEDAAQTVSVADAPAIPALVGLSPPQPGLAPPAAAAAAPWNPALARMATAPAGLGSAPGGGPLGNALAAPAAEVELPIVAAAADLAARGKFLPPAEGEIRREVAFDASLLQQHQSTPAPSTAIHAGAIAPSPAPAAQVPVAALEAGVGKRGWDQGLGDKLVWMAGHRQQVAQLHLNPPELGPLKITLTLDHDQASVQFVSAHAPVREAIEAAMPRLREMLADSGVTLGNASVSTDAFREQAQPQHHPRAHPAPPAAAAGAVTRGERPLRHSHGMVDTYA